MVYPQGTVLTSTGETHWNSGGTDNKSGTDDIGFVETLLDQLEETRNIDTDRDLRYRHVKWRHDELSTRLPTQPAHCCNYIGNGHHDSEQRHLHWQPSGTGDANSRHRRRAVVPFNGSNSFRHSGNY